MNKFTQALDFRHACKLFDNARGVSMDDMNFILEAGRKSPSSFGLEPWKFLVITNQEIKALLQQACFNQPQLTTGSHVVVLLARNAANFAKGSSYLRKSFGRKASGEKLENIQNIFDNYYNYLGGRVDDWARMQVYLASANMMSAAAYIGIDSCPIEGFDYQKTEEILKKYTSYRDGNFNIAYLIVFGYRAQEQSKQLRLDISEIVEFIE